MFSYTLRLNALYSSESPFFPCWWTNPIDSPHNFNFSKRIPSNPEVSTKEWGFSPSSSLRAPDLSIISSWKREIASLMICQDRLLLLCERWFVRPGGVELLDAGYLGQSHGEYSMTILSIFSFFLIHFLWTQDILAKAMENIPWQFCQSFPFF